MAVKILHKRSAVEFKSATGAQLELGELALNYHESGPYLQCKDAAGEIVQLGGVYIGASAPGNELQGAWWLRDSDNTLFLYDGTKWVSIAGGGGGGGGIISIIGGDGIEATEVAGEVTVEVDLATNSHGLSIVGGKLQADIATDSTLGTVKIGSGIDVDAAGEISVDLSGVDVNADLGYTAAVDKGTVTNTAGDDATLPLADGTNAGLFTAAEKLKLDGIEAGAQVNGKPVFIGETPPSTPADGDLWWNSSDDSGRLYVYYDDGDSKQWVEASPQGDTLTEGDADDLYLSKVSDDTAAGEITFEGLTTHEGGVKVTAGAALEVINGLLYSASSEETRVINDGTRGLAVNRAYVEVNCQPDATAGAVDTNGFKSLAWSPDNDTSAGQHQHTFYTASANSSAYDKYKLVKGFNINPVVRNLVEDVAGNSGFGFYSEVGGLSQASLFNFYGASGAQNFFQGDTYIGGTTARNTFELWKSTLTEEQKEQLAAGTLVAPANVSLPGDGEFARQWWYDQQSAEDQALIDSGELDYPERLQPANFTDTFALGDNTNIKLASSGTSEFKNDIRVDTDPSDATTPFTLLSRGQADIERNYDDTLGHNRQTLRLGRSGAGWVASRLYAPPDGNGATNGSHYNIHAVNYYNSGGIGTNASYHRPAVFGSNNSFQNGFDNTKTGNQLRKYGYFTTSSSEYDQATLDPDDADDAKQIGEAVGFGAWNKGVKNFRGFEFLNSGSDNINNTGFYSQLDIKTGADNWSNYHAGTAPNYFAGVIRTGNVTNPGGTGGDSNPETNDSNRFWATQSTSSNGVRIGGTALQSSYYATSEFGSNIFCNRLGSTLGSFIEFLENGVSVDAISLDGSGGISYGVSDYRLKENIVDLPSATDAVKSLHPVNYNFITHPGKTRPGFIAHELAGVLPVAVTGEKDATVAIGTLADYDGTVLETEVTEPSAEELEYTEDVDTDGVTTQVVRTRTWTPSGTRPVYQGVDQTKLIPLLTKALQEVMQKNEDLEARIAALEGA